MVGTCRVSSLALVHACHVPDAIHQLMSSATFPRPAGSYTDGAYEVCLAGFVRVSVGTALVIEPDRMSRRSVFDVPSADLEALGPRSQKQVVGQEEPLTFLIAIVWGKVPAHRPS